MPADRRHPPFGRAGRRDPCPPAAKRQASGGEEPVAAGLERFRRCERRTSKSGEYPARHPTVFKGKAVHSSILCLVGNPQWELPVMPDKFSQPNAIRRFGRLRTREKPRGDRIGGGRSRPRRSRAAKSPDGRGFSPPGGALCPGPARPRLPRRETPSPSCARRYWYPRYLYIRRRGFSRDDSEDLPDHSRRE
jgi:hypothetical protein